MKRLLIKILFFQMLVMAGSCQKPEPWKPSKPPVTPATLPTNLEVVWIAPFYSDSTGDSFWNFAVANSQYIVLPNRFDRRNDKPRGIGVYNMQTGQRHSAWQNDPGGIFTMSENESLDDCKVAGKNKDIILIYNRYNLFGYNLHSGQRIWSVTIRDQGATGIPKMSAEGDFAFISYGPGGALSKSWYRLAMVNVYSGEKREILQLNIEDNYEFAIMPPSVYVNNIGDTLLFFTTGGVNFETVDNRIHAYCYNLTKKQMVWINKQFTTAEFVSISASDPIPYIIESDKLIITSTTGIHCFNPHTGKLVWQKEGLSLSLAPPLYWEEKIYIRSGDPCILLCLDAQSGQVLWENTAINPIPAPHGRMAVYKDRLYFSAWGTNASCHLACVDIRTGQELWKDLGPYGAVLFDVLIDQQTGYLYCNLGWSTLCVDLNKTPKE